MPENGEKMDSNSLLNQAVIHGSYGRGIITGTEEKYIEVDFPNAGKKCRFCYPSCFHGFLKLEKTEMQEEADAIAIAHMKESGELKRQQMWEHYRVNMKRLDAKRYITEKKKTSSSSYRGYSFRRSSQ